MAEPLLIDASRLEQMYRQAQGAAERAALVNRLATQIYQSFDVDQIAALITDELSRILDLDRCIFFRVDEPSDAIEPTREFRKPNILSAAQSYKLSALRDLVRLAREVGVIAISDVKNDPRTQSLYQEYYEPVGIRSVVYSSVLNDGKLRAVISLGMVSRLRGWKPEELELVRAVTNQVGIALRQAELYQQAQAAAERNARLYEQVKQSERKYRDIFENAVVGMYQTTPSGKILTANLALARMLGFESVEELLSVEVEGQFYVDTAERRKNVEVLNRTCKLSGAEFELRRKDGSRIVVQEHARAVTDELGQVLYFEGTLIDITEKKLLERQLLHAQRLESVGTLAAGVAHHFNNLLTVILGYTSLLQAEAKDDDPQRESLFLIEQSAKRAAELTAQLLTFSRQITAQPVALNLNEVVSRVMSFLRRSIDASITIRLEAAPELWNIEADPTQVEQVLMNLCINARDAMPNGGELTVTIENIVLEEADPRLSFGDARPGEYVALKISDTGVGMPEDQAARIFDPFFTTKEVGKGTGLGLAIVYGIVRSCGGIIDLKSKLNLGTSVSVYFPATHPSDPLPIEAPKAPSEFSEKILVVDDEPAVLRVAKTILNRRGFEVFTAGSGAEALEIYQQQKDSVAVVILDLTMPEMSGIACYKWLCQINPQIKVILTSGYSLDNIDSDILVENNVTFVQKPYRIEELIEAIRMLLDHPMGSDGKK
jgi:hypothetical protein